MGAAVSPHEAAESGGRRKASLLPARGSKWIPSRRTPRRQSLGSTSKPAREAEAGSSIPCGPSARSCSSSPRRFRSEVTVRRGDVTPPSGLLASPRRALTVVPPPARDRGAGVLLDAGRQRRKRRVKLPLLGVQARLQAAHYRRDDDDLVALLPDLDRERWPAERLSKERVGRPDAPGGRDSLARRWPPSPPGTRRRSARPRPPRSRLAAHGRSCLGRACARRQPGLPSGGSQPWRTG
jgi:hypothetical protein